MRTLPARQLVLTATLALAAAPAFADDAQAARLAATCAACHGTSGHAATKAVPGLAGRSKADLVELMQAFKAGKRPATIMHQISKGYSDAQIEMMAGYFADQKK